MLMSYLGSGSKYLRNSLGGGPSWIIVRSLGDSAGLCSQASEPVGEEGPQWDACGMDPYIGDLLPGPPQLLGQLHPTSPCPVPQSVTGTKIISPNYRPPTFPHPVLTAPSQVLLSLVHRLGTGTQWIVGGSQAV